MFNLHGECVNISVGLVFLADSKRSCFLQQHRGSTSSSASLEDNNQPSAHGLKLTTPWSFMRRDENGLACQLQVWFLPLRSSTVGRPSDILR